MTLLIGTLARNHVVLSADGRSVRRTNTTTLVTRDDLPKVFPFSRTPLAIAHHGENELNGCKVHEIINGIIRGIELTPEQMGPRAMTGAIISFFDPLITKTLLTKRLADKCAFWIFGFHPDEQFPSGYEVAWHRANQTDLTLSMRSFGDVCLGGDGSKHVIEFLTQPMSQEFSYAAVFNKPIDYSLAFHDQLFKIAVERRDVANDTRFGGHHHVLKITRDGCAWAKPPSLLSNSAQS